MSSRTPAPLEPDRNALLERLRRSDRRHLEEIGRPVAFELGATLAEPDQRVRHVYFPLSGFASLLTPANGTVTLEVGLVGREGMLGGTLALGVDHAPLHVLVQGAGSALRLSSAQFRAAMLERPALRELALQYCYVTLRQVAQTAACTHYHSVQERLARWLLMTQDRANGGTFHLTQEFLGIMLGARRAGISTAAGALQRRGLIGYLRGEILVIDRKGLQAVSCGCYDGAKRIYDATLG
jgi:CRP-like cAMP-binding protein